MTRTVSESRTRPTAERIRRAAIDLFVKEGYQSTSLRDLGREAGIEPASIYYYYPSKQDLLFALLDQAMDEMLAGVRKAIGLAGTPADRLRAAVRFHVLYHARSAKWAFLSRTEVRSLSGARYRTTLEKRDRYERIFRGVIDEGVAASLFSASDVPITTMALLTMCSGVADWFSRGGRFSAEAIADQYAQLALRMVGFGLTAPGRGHERS